MPTWKLQTPSWSIGDSPDEHDGQEIVAIQPSCPRHLLTEHERCKQGRHDVAHGERRVRQAQWHTPDRTASQKTAPRA